MPQLSFTWPASPSYAPEDFIVSSANEEAVRFLETWPIAGQPQTAWLSGPEACGKTHLALTWTKRTQATLIYRNLLGTVDSASLWQGKAYAMLEDIDAATPEEPLFHLLRHAETHGVFLLLTSRFLARGLPFALADLRSRLLSLPGAAIHAPDEELLKGFLFKCFTDRQLSVGEDLVGYLARRTERSFAAARALAEAVEARAASENRKITIALAREVLR
jgi:chromosomal replication initiation ATPase DnaA